MPDKANTVIVLPAGSTEQLLNDTGMVFGGDAATMGAGVITDQRMKVTYDMMVAMKLLDASKVDVKKTYTTQFVKDIKVLP